MERSGPQLGHKLRSSRLRNAMGRRPPDRDRRQALPLEVYYVAVHDFARLGDAVVVIVSQYGQRCEDQMIRR
jgi:hypothetical protein